MTRLYLANDTSARAVGTARLAETWKASPDVQLIRTSTRGAFYLEPMVEQDTTSGRVAWFNIHPDDLPRLVAGVDGTPVDSIPFFRQQTRYTFANFGVTEPLALDAYQARDGFQGLAAALAMGPEAV
ncbi:MAG TPA: formate dehydrogenase, partial [Nitrospiraceae bacterium]